jgi:hypothetical protein
MNMITLDDFQQPECNVSDVSNVLKTSDVVQAEQELSVPLNPSMPVIRNWPLVKIMIQGAFARQPERVALLLNSNGSPDKPATQWQLRRVVS